MTSPMTAILQTGFAAGLPAGGAVALSFFFLAGLALISSFGKSVLFLEAEDASPKGTDKNRTQASLARRLEDPERFLREINMARGLAASVYLLFGACVTAPVLTSAMGLSGGSGAWLQAGIILVLLLLLFLLGLDLPGRVSGKKAGRLARNTWFLMLLILLPARLADRLVFYIGSGLIRLFRLEEVKAPEPAPTEEEFLQMLEAGHAKGAIEDDNRELIANLFDFDDKIAGEIMTHRTEIEALPLEAGLSETMAFLHSTKYTRFPVYQDSVDNIIGVLHAKDLLFFMEQSGGSEFSLSAIMRPAWFTPETRNVSDLLRDMQQNHIQMAIVIDEYGGTAGLLTIEDLVEQIVGNIEDEYDEGEQEMIEIASDTWLVDGSYPVDKLARLTGIELDDDEYDTVAGLIIELLDRIPEEHERPAVTLGCLTFQVLSVADNRIVRVRVTRMPQEEGPDHGQ